MPALSADQAAKADTQTTHSGRKTTPKPIVLTDGDFVGAGTGAGVRKTSIGKNLGVLCVPPYPAIVSGISHRSAV